MNTRLTAPQSLLRAGPIATAVVAATVLAACGSSARTPVTSAGAPPPTSVVAASATSAPKAVLGRADRPNARGLGTARPTVIDLGGADGTGIVENVTWQSWDGPTATATGTAGYVAADAPLASAVQEKATIVASDLGDCRGLLAYRRVGWYFPQHGDTSATDNTIQICED